MTLKEQIENYKPMNEQEAKDREQMLRFMRDYRDVLTRENPIGHFSSSACVVNPKRDRMLVVYHKIYDGWIYPGGHADGEEDLLSVAVREVKEETGLEIEEKDLKYLFTVPNYYNYSDFVITSIDIYSLLKKVLLMMMHKN